MAEKKKPKVYPADRKGAKIRIVGGTYRGKRGFLDKKKGRTEFFTYVIIVIKPNEEEIATRLHHESIRVGEEAPPASYEEAVLQQHCDIEELLRDLTRRLSQCEGISSEGEAGHRIGNLFLNYLTVAVQRQSNLRVDKARWRRVRYGHG